MVDSFQLSAAQLLVPDLTHYAKMKILNPTKILHKAVSEVGAAQRRLKLELLGIAKSYKCKNLTALVELILAVRDDQTLTILRLTCPEVASKLKMPEATGIAPEKTQVSSNRKRRVAVTPELRALVVTLLKSGTPVLTISNQVGLTVTPINRIKREIGLIRAKK